MLTIRTFKGLTEISGGGDGAEMCVDIQEVIFTACKHWHEKVTVAKGKEKAIEIIEKILMEAMTELAKEGVINGPQKNIS